MRNTISQKKKLKNFSPIDYLIQHLISKKDPQRFEDMLSSVKDNYDNLTKSNLSKYSSKVEKAVRGTLTSNKIFQFSPRDKKWSIKDKVFAQKLLEATEAKMRSKNPTPMNPVPVSFCPLK
jgi:hypothetical protein